MAGWLGGWRGGDRLAALVGAPVRVRVVEPARDPHAAVATVRVNGVSLGVRGGAAAIRAIAQRLLGGPDELAAPRPLPAAAEHAVLCARVCLRCRSRRRSRISAYPARCGRARAAG